jgi:DNA-binding transcriptional LysR family regulator
MTISFGKTIMQNANEGAPGIEPTKDSAPHTKNGPLNLRDLRDWDDLRVFVTTIKAGSLNRAARALRLQQPTVTRRLRRLEDNTGVKLVERWSHGVTPTQEGRRLFAHLEDFADAASKGLSGLHLATEPRRDIKVRMTEGLATYWLARVIPDLQRDMPHIRLKLLTAAYSQEPRHSVHDFEVSFAFPEELTMTVKRLGALHFVPMASRSYVERHGLPRGKRDLGRHALLENALLASQEGSWSQLLDLPEADDRIVAVLNSMNAYAEFVSAGAGIGLLPTYFQFLRPDLVRVDLPVTVSWPFHLIRPGGRKPDPDLDQFQAWLEAQFDRKTYPCFAAYAE